MESSRGVGPNNSTAGVDIDKTGHAGKLLAHQGRGQGDVIAISAPDLHSPRSLHWTSQEDVLPEAQFNMWKFRIFMKPGWMPGCPEGCEPSACLVVVPHLESDWY